MKLTHLAKRILARLLLFVVLGSAVFTFSAHSVSGGDGGGGLPFPPPIPVPNGPVPLPADTTGDSLTPDIEE